MQQSKVNQVILAKSADSDQPSRATAVVYYGQEKQSCIYAHLRKKHVHDY